MFLQVFFDADNLTKRVYNLLYLLYLEMNDALNNDL